MLNRLLLTTLLFILAFTAVYPAAATEDWGPVDVCEDQSSPYYRPVFPVYEYRNRRLVLKDLHTRADVLEVEINLSQWSKEVSECGKLVE
jgi:protein involved in sex pheromone biosynthesis